MHWKVLIMSSVTSLTYPLLRSSSINLIECSAHVNMVLQLSLTFNRLDNTMTAITDHCASTFHWIQTGVCWVIFLRKFSNLLDFLRLNVIHYVYFAPIHIFPLYSFPMCHISCCKQTTEQGHVHYFAFVFSNLIAHTTLLFAIHTTDINNGTDSKLLKTSDNTKIVCYGVHGRCQYYEK